MAAPAALVRGPRPGRLSIDVGHFSTGYSSPKRVRAVGRSRAARQAAVEATPVTASRPSVLVGFADALAAPEAVGSLLNAGYRVASFSRRGRRVALRRMHNVELVDVTAPEVDFEACAREVAAAASAHDVVMPLDDPAVLVCDQGLPADALVAGPRGPQARFALDKREQLNGASTAGLAVPAWTEIQPDSDMPGDSELPAVLTPALAAEVLDGRLRRPSPRLVSTVTQLHDLHRSWGLATPAIVQRWVPGVGAVSSGSPTMAESIT